MYRNGSGEIVVGMPWICAAGATAAAQWRS